MDFCEQTSIAVQYSSIHKLCIFNVLAIGCKKIILVHVWSFYPIYSKYSMDPCWHGDVKYMDIISGLESPTPQG